MQGIYKIENKVNHKIYIGQSCNIENRWKQHLSMYTNVNNHKYGPKLYSAFIKYGIENFDFIVQEEIVNHELLTEREQYWINYYDSINNGYNCIDARDPMKFENNIKAKLTFDQVLEIMDKLKNTSISFYKLAEEYDINARQITRINMGETWHLDNIEYPLRKKEDYNKDFSAPGEMSGRSKLSNEEVMKIRERYVNESVNQIWEDYKDYYSLSGFKKVVQGPSYPNLPLYKKSIKKWVNPA